MEKITFDGANYFLTWHEGKPIPLENITQVSGYIFNDDNELLLVKVGKNWTIPGGKPEIGETPIDTLNREIREEAKVTTETPQFIGYVKVQPEQNKDNIHYQLRFKARVDEINDFIEDFEASERRFIPLSQVKDYIKWFHSNVFQLELKAASCLNINKNRTT